MLYYCFFTCRKLNNKILENKNKSDFGKLVTSETQLNPRKRALLHCCRCHDVITIIVTTTSAGS